MGEPARAAAERKAAEGRRLAAAERGPAEARARLGPAAAERTAGGWTGQKAARH